MRAYLPLDKIPSKLIYLLCGYDPWQLIDGLDKIKRNYVEAKRYCFSNLVQFINFLQQDQDQLFNQDLFCLAKINKILEIHLGESKFTKLQQLELEKFFNKLSVANNLVVIFIANQAIKTIEKTKLFTFIDQHGLVLISRNLNAIQFKQWVIAEFKLANLQLEEIALNKFIEKHNHNLLAAKQTIAKLKLVFIDKTIRLKDLLEYIETDQAKYSLFDLQDGLKNSIPIEKLLKIIDNLKTQQIEPILILWAIIQVLKGLNDQIRENTPNEIANKIAFLWQQAAKIDFEIKQVDAYTSDLKINRQAYVWGLIGDLCLNISIN